MPQACYKDKRGSTPGKWHPPLKELTVAEKEISASSLLETSRAYHAAPRPSVQKLHENRPPIVRRSPGLTPPLVYACDKHVLLRHMTSRQVLGWLSHFKVSTRRREHFTRVSFVTLMELFHLRGKGSSNISQRENCSERRCDNGMAHPPWFCRDAASRLV